MSTTLSAGQDTVVVGWDFENIIFAGSNAKFANNFTYSGSPLSNGTAAGQADLLYAATLTLAGAATTTLNLSSLTSAFGATMVFVRLKGLYIENVAGAPASSSIAVGNAGTTPFAGIISPGTATIAIRNGCNFYIGLCQDATGYVVGSGVNLLITNVDSVNTATVRIRIVGCSA